MQQGHDDFREPQYFGAVRTKLGQTLREQHDLTEPLAPGLVELLGQLDTTIRVRGTTRERLYAEIDECIAAMVQATYRTSHEPGEA
jgi:hypothetical protein